MKYITLLSIILFFSIGCGDSKKKEVESASAVTETAFAGAEAALKSAEEIKNEVNTTLGVINFTEEDIKNATPENKTRMEVLMKRVESMNSDMTTWYNRSVTLKDELAVANQQLSEAKTKMAQGASYEEAFKDISPNFLNTSELEKTVQNSIIEFKSYREEQQTKIDLLLSYYDTLKKG